VSYQKGIAPILIVILLAALVAGYLIWSGYSNNRTKPIPTTQTAQVTNPPSTSTSTATPSSSQTPNETTNWKIYVSKERGFSIEYPPDYDLRVGKIAYVDGVESDAPNTIQIVSKGTPNFLCNIVFKNVDPSKTLIQNINSERQQSQQGGLEFDSGKGTDYLLGGSHGLLYADAGAGAYGPVTYIYAMNKGELYSFYIESHGNFSDIKNDLNKLLSTFKFTN